MNAKQTAQIQAALDSANGKRRERLADLLDVARVVSIVAKGEPGTGLRRICGTVPNSYKYRASATAIVAARVGEEVRVRILDGYAAKVSGGGNGYTESAKNNDVAALLAETAPEGTIVLPVASAKRWPISKSA